MIDKRGPALTAWLYLGALVLAVLSIGPAIYLALVAFQPPTADLTNITAGFTTDPDSAFTLDNFREAWRPGSTLEQIDENAPPPGPGLARPLLNSVIITVVRTITNVLLAALAAYPLARMRFRGRGILFVAILATMMIPEQVIVVPMFRIVVSMGLYDTLIAAILPFSVSAFGIYLCRQAFMSIPFDLEEAARIDGANSMQIWWHVMLPLAGPTLATLAVFSVIAAWSDLLWPLVVLQSEHNHTLPVAINRLLGVFATNIRIAYAASVLALIPIIVFFLIAQRFLKAGIFAGAVKG